MANTFGNYKYRLYMYIIYVCGFDFNAKVT